MKDETHLTHFKYLYCFLYLFPFKFFREILANKGPSLKAIIEKGEVEGFSRETINPNVLKTALQAEFPDWYDWFPALLAELKLLQKTIDIIELTKVNYNADNKIIQIYVDRGANSSVNGKKSTGHIMEKLGPPIWKSIHNYAKTWDGSIEAQDKFLKEVQARIPCGECKNFWINENKENPAPTDNADVFFAWTVDVHNKVNTKLGKPVMTLEEVVNLYPNEN